jgi:hypothetical protein
MAKDVKFNIKLNIDGREHVVEVSTDLKEMAKKSLRQKLTPISSETALLNLTR